MNKFTGTVWALVFAFLACHANPILAQNAVTVTTNAGDVSAGSFAEAVTLLNNLGDGNILFDYSPAAPIMLSQPVSSLSVGATLQGQAVTIVGQDNGQAILTFRQNFTLDDDFELTLTNDGFLGTGLDSGITAGSWSLSGNSSFSLSGGKGADVTTSGGVTVTGGAGGNASVTTGFLSMESQSIASITGGLGGAVTDSLGSWDKGGKGGNASMCLEDWNFMGSSLFLEGGLGGPQTDLGGSGGAGGNGGSASVSMGSGQSGAGSTVVIQGGNGGISSGGGRGGAATLTAGSVTLTDSQWSFSGGTGGESGHYYGGTGGETTATIGSLNMDSSAQLTLQGGDGGNGVYGAGDAGGVSLSAGSMILDGSGTGFAATGGTGGQLTLGGYGPNNAGNGGQVILNVGSLEINSGALFSVSGGSGGDSPLTNLAGGMGGNANVTVGSIGLGSQAAMGVAGGSGGTNGGFNGQAWVTAGSVTQETGSLLSVIGGSGGGDGIAGGSAYAFLGPQSLAAGSIFTLTGGTGGDGPVSGGYGGQATAIVTDLTMTSGSMWQVLGGAGGTGGSADGVSGNVSVNIFTLHGSGSISLNGCFGNLDIGAGSFDGAISGNMGLRKVTNGALTLTGANTFSGGTTISGGTLNVLGDGNLGASGVTLTLDGGTLQISADFSSSRNIQVTDNNGGFDTNGFDSTLSGVLSGAGLFNKQGSGTLALTNTNTLEGDVLITQGTLEAGNAQALGTGSVEVGDGNLTVTGGPLTLQVGGDYTQTSSGSLGLGLRGSGGVSSDALSVGGTANLGGSLILSIDPGFTAPAVGEGVTLLTAGAVNGRFDNINPYLSINGSRFLFLYQPAWTGLKAIVPSFELGGSTLNQSAIGTDLESVYTRPELFGMVSAIGGLSDASLKSVYNQISPAAMSGLYQAGFEAAALKASLLGQRLSRLRTGTTGSDFLNHGSLGILKPWFVVQVPERETPFVSKPQASRSGGEFIDGNGGFFSVAGDDNASGYQITSYGLAGAGMDRWLSEDLALGLFVGYGHTEVKPEEGGTFTVNGGQLGLYGTWLIGNGLYADAVVHGGLDSYNTERLSYGGTATGVITGGQYSGALEMGYEWVRSDFSWGPYVCAQYAQVNLDAFSEAGSMAPLAFPAQNQTSLSSRLGLRIGGRLDTGGMILSPALNVAWAHEFNTTGGSVQAGFGPGDSFTVAGPAFGPDGVLAGLGVNVELAKSLNLSLHYQGELFRNHLDSQQFGGGMEFKL